MAKVWDGFKSPRRRTATRAVQLPQTSAIEAMNQLNTHGIRALWYLAHLANVPSILSTGILSHHDVANRGLSHERIDWSSVQRWRVKVFEIAGQRFLLHDRVPLFFSSHQPMLYVQQERRGIAHLEVDPAVLQLDGCVFTDGNAASNETRVYDRLEELAQLDWRVIQTIKCYSKEYKRKKAAEVLAISPVPPRYVRRVHVADPNAKAQLGQLPVSVEVSPHLYTW